MIGAITGGGATLTFTPAANAFGTVTITVTLQDDGGTANSGVDTVVRTFTITVERSTIRRPSPSPRTLRQ